jgi:predicted ATP-grasp superfamily ATP-dependent carboligase
MTAIVTCGHTRPGLAAVRALGRAQIAVAVAAPVRPALASWSRYATSTLLVPDAGTDARRFADAIAEEAAGRRAHLVLPATDAALWALSRWREAQPEGVTRVLPPHDAVARSLDRSALHDRARTLGVRCIDAVRVDRQEAVEPALRKIAGMGGVPVIVRPFVAWVEREDGTRRVAESLPVDNIADLRRLLHQREDLVTGGCLIEPRPHGRWLGYGAVCDDGRVLAEIFQERLRERGDLSGVSTLARTLPPDEEVRAAAQAVLGSLNWQGPALVEMLRTDTGELLLVNVIGRLWGSIQLAINAGVDVPLLCDALARRERLPEVTQVAEPDHVWRWVVGDLEVLATRTRKLFARIDGRGALRRRVAALREMLDVHDLLQAQPDVFDADDPMPFILEVEHRVEEARRLKQSAQLLHA